MELFEIDPLTGIHTYFEFTNEGKLVMRYEQDVQPVIDHCKALANEGLPDEAFRKNGVSVYAVIPMVVLGQMAKKGIKFLDQNHIGAVVREINTEYPWLKTTTKHHEVR